MNNPLIKAVSLDRSAPPEISRIIDRLDILTRNVLVARLNNLTNGKSNNTVEFDWGACVGFADALMFTGKIDAHAQNDLATYARLLAHPDEQYRHIPKQGE